MKKWFSLLILLFIIYFSVQFLIQFYSKGHTITYQIKTDEKIFKINETYSANQKNEMNNYYFDILYGTEKYSIQTLEDFQKKKQIIKKIYHVKTDNYSCIFPIFLNEKILTDIICLKDNIQYNYHTIYKTDKKVDEFVNRMKANGYDSTLYVDRKNDAIKENLYTLYPNNIVENHIVSFSTYKGNEIIFPKQEDSVKSISIFNNDIYESKIKIMFKNYYLIANYNTPYEFDTFYLVNLTTGYYKKLTTSNKISFDSYIQGTVDDSVYLYDCDNKIQYEINVLKETIEIAGNSNKGYKIYTNGTWEVKPLKDIVDKTILFTEEQEQSIENYTFLIKTNTTTTGYYYYYQRVNDDYQIYRSNAQNKEKLTYLTTVSSVNDFKAFDDYIYFIENNEIYYYHDLTGVRTLIHYPELEFNKNIIYQAYSK